MGSLAKMPRYEAYIDSDIDWLGDIPSEWRVEKAKWLFLRAERPVSKDDAIVTCFRDGQVTLRSNRRTDGFTNATKEHGYQGIRKGDLVIHAMDAFAGAIGVSDSDGKSTPVYAACMPRIPNLVNPTFYAYYMRDLALSGFIVSLAKGIRERSTDFRFNDFAKLPLPLPSIEEQNKIVSFLDQKTAQIDEAIAIKEKQIALLKERKKIIIQKAVTKGLDPDVPMKESCVDWIGQIPEHWDLKKMKFIFEAIQTGTTPTTSNPKYFDGGVDWYNPKDLNAGYLDKSEKTISKLAIKHGEAKIFSGNSVLIVGIGATCGKTAYLKEASSFNQQITGFNSRYQNSEFMYFLISTYSKVMLNVASYTTLPILNNEFFKQFMLPCPPRNEQDSIVSFLRSESEKLERAIEMQQQQIANLKEYKATLINSAVTGKIKVA